MEDVVFAVPRLMSSDPKQIEKIIQNMKGGGHISGIITDRPSYNDIVNTIKTCLTCRCMGHTENASNPEYKWAKNYLKKLKNKKSLIKIK